jgi:hypothetical protein
LNIIFVSYKTTLVVILLLLLSIQFPVHAEDTLKTLPLTRESARALFQDAVDKQQKTDAVLEILQEDILLPDAIRLVYRGALQTLKARDASFPLTKMKWMKRGLATIKEARTQDSLNIEIIFVQGVVWQKIPRLFGYRDDAHRNFEILISLLPDQWKDYHPQFIQEILLYLREESGLSPEQLERLNTIENQFIVYQSGE